MLSAALNAIIQENLCSLTLLFEQACILKDLQLAENLFVAAENVEQQQF